MAGVPRLAKEARGKEAAASAVTTWGRYAKVLLSSSEFLFVN